MKLISPDNTEIKLHTANPSREERRRREIKK
jgi:hypothetical protein